MEDTHTDRQADKLDKLNMLDLLDMSSKSSKTSKSTLWVRGVNDELKGQFALIAHMQRLSYADLLALLLAHFVEHNPILKDNLTEQTISFKIKIVDTNPEPKTADLYKKKPKFDEAKIKEYQDRIAHGETFRDLTKGGRK